MTSRVSLVALTLVAGVWCTSPLSALQATDTPPQQEHDTSLVVIRGCVANSVFSSTHDDTVDETRTMAEGQTYRLTGPKEVLKTLKSHHNGHWEEITGRLKGTTGPQGTMQKKKVGKLSIVLGTSNGNDVSGSTPQVPYMPSFEVHSFKHLDNQCPR